MKRALTTLVALTAVLALWAQTDSTTVKKKKERTEDEQGMLDAYDTPVDFRKPENIRPLIDFVRK